MDAEKRLNDLIAITTRLINVLERENEMLREHRHSDIHSILDEKATIGRVYESRVIGLSENPGALAEGPPELREQLAELAHKVDRLMADNSVMLKISVDVSRRVVNLIAEAATEPTDDGAGHEQRGDDRPLVIADRGGNQPRNDAKVANRGDDPSADASSDKRADRGDANSSDTNTDKSAAKDAGATEKRSDKAASNDGATEAAGNDAVNTDPNAGAEQAEAPAASAQSSSQQAVMAYAAGAIGMVVTDHAKVQGANGAAKSANGAVQAAQAAGPEEATQNNAANVNLVVAANAVRQGTHTQTNAGQHSQQQANAAANNGGQAQKTEAGANPEKANAIREQAQQLSKVIGDGNKANVTVTVNKEQNQLTSKPTQNIVNVATLAADSNASQQSGQQSQSGTQHQTAPNTAVQIGVQQTQQAAAGPQQVAGGPQATNGGAGTDARGPIGGATQAASAQGQHAGAGESASLNNQSSTAPSSQSQQTQQTREAAQAHAQQTARAQIQGQPLVDQISVKITKALQAGNDRITIHLKPEDLGRVDVKMELTHDGRVMAVVTADKQETLDLLRRDASELQRALADAGLKSGDMEFNLRGDQGKTANDDGQTSGSAGNDTEPAAEEQTSGDGVVAAWQSGIYNNGRLDVRA